MANNIEKIGLVNPNDSNILDNNGVEFPSHIRIKPDVEVGIKAIVKEGATRRPKWIAKPREKGPFTTKDMNGHTGDIMGAKIEAKYCGAQKYHIEAFIGDPINKAPNRIIVQGVAPEKIVKAVWSKSKSGSTIGSSPNKFGDDIWLYVETEGLNGTKLNITVYNEQWGDDGFVASYIATCYSGEVNLNIKDTCKWRARTGLITDNSEEFYVKLKVLGKDYYISDKSGEHNIAQHIIFKDKITKKTSENSTSNLPLLVGENEIDLERYEPCRFKKIIVIDDGDEIELFEEGKLKIEEDKKKDFPVSEQIFFDFEKWNIRAGAKEVLDGIAEFLLDSPFLPVDLGAHCDSRGSHDYNDKLSYKRSAASVDYLISKGVSSTRITAIGYGKRRPFITGENLTEAQHQINRRVTIEFNIFGGDAESIKFSTVAPDKSFKKDIVIRVDEYKVKECFRSELSDEHDDTVYVVESIQKTKSKPEPYNKVNVNHPVYSDSTNYKLAPLDFILPHKVTPNVFLYYINSCRYYSDKKKATIAVKVYPDIKWDFHVFGKLSNPLGLTWSGVDTVGAKEMKDATDKIIALDRFEKSEAAFGFALNASWNKVGKKYHDKFAFAYTYKDKFKKFYELFNAVSQISQTIADLTGSEIKGKKVGKKASFDVGITPPNVALGAEWQLARASDDGVINSKIGTLIKPYLKADPLIGMAVTFDLLALTIKAVSIGTTGNTAAADLFLMVREWADKGYESERVTVQFKMWIDAILSGAINAGINGEFNTESSGDTEISVEMTGQVDVELSIGVELTGKVIIYKTGTKEGKAVGLGGEATAKATASSGKLGVVFGGKIKYEQNEGLFLQPILLLQECTASGVILIEVKFSTKKHSGSLDILDEEWSKTFWEETDLLEKKLGKDSKFKMINL